MTAVRSACALLACLLLAACAGTPATAPLDWGRQQARLTALDHFTASGKIALRSAEQAESGSLLWQQAGPATHIRLSGPLGLAATTVDSDGQILEVRQGEQYSVWRLDDPAVSDDGTWNLPLRALAYWLRGIPAPHLPVQNLELGADTGLPELLEQDGWTIRYRDYGEYQGYTLPTRVEAVRDASSARILVRDWRDLSGDD